MLDLTSDLNPFSGPEEVDNGFHEGPRGPCEFLHLAFVDGLFF